ncbi:MAG: crossover junction endodeoxyribonuclease RuvC [bacterium]|nr:crossover junction endodeoxyribonuclease RuvC [bacterium]
MRILGIDPGLRITGYGCLEISAADETLIEAGAIRLGRNGPEGIVGNDADAELRNTASVSDRLMELDRDFRAILERLRPSAVAIEAVFAHYKHPATAIVMGHARGVLLLAVRSARLTLIELKPNEVKKSMTGFGHASKEQMQDAVQARYRLAEPPNPPDVADAIAIAACGLDRWRLGTSGLTNAKGRGGASRSVSRLPDHVRAQIARDE